MLLLRTLFAGPDVFLITEDSCTYNGEATHLSIGDDSQARWDTLFQLTLILLMLFYLPNPMFDHLLESSPRDDSIKCQNRIWWRNKNCRIQKTVFFIWSPGLAFEPLGLCWIIVLLSVTEHIGQRNWADLCLGQT